MSSESCLYLSARQKSDNDEIETTIESYICTFVYVYCDFDIDICFVNDADFYPCSVPSSVFANIKHSFINKFESNDELNLVLPSVKSDAGKLFISGLCAVLRWLIKDKLTKIPDHFSNSLLGFRGGCLVACTESSIWTMFCEVDMPRSVNFFTKYMRDRNGVPCDMFYVPFGLYILERHFKRPVRTHNILKRKLDIAKEVKNTAKKDQQLKSESSEMNFTLRTGDEKPVQNGDLVENLKNLVITEKTKEFSLNHCFLEGIDLTLADMVVFPCVYTILKMLPFREMQTLENIFYWYKRMINNSHIREAAEKCGMKTKSILETLNGKDPLHDDGSLLCSLYKRDRAHSKLRIKYKNPSDILMHLQEFSIHPCYSESSCTQLDWNSLPKELHPATGDLPAKRVERKCQQVESVVTAVLKVAVEGQTVVEFCAGGGHVGLLLAYLLPKCQIILIENKESSMQRAILRAKALNLKNIVFYQCNLDYFKCPFDLGVSLHACGVATDLVIQQCLKNQASFVSCPCCYGNIENTHLLKYPLSKKFRDSKLSYEKYTLLAHCADRNEVNTPTAEQGELCMGLIDTDRVHLAQEHEYEVELSTLNPKSCSPKHNLLIGVSPKWKRNRSS